MSTGSIGIAGSCRTYRPFVPASALLTSVTLTALGAPAPGEPDSHDSGHLRGSAWCQTIFVHVRGPALVGAEDVPALVELKVAVPHLKPAGWWARAVSFVYPFRCTGRHGGGARSE